jgi:hypothetical protein
MLDRLGPKDQVLLLNKTWFSVFRLRIILSEKEVVFLSSFKGLSISCRHIFSAIGKKDKLSIHVADHL